MESTLLSFNTWSGSVPGFHSYLRKVAKGADYLALQEVHRACIPEVPTTVMPQNPGSRSHPLRAHLCQELDTWLQKDWETVFVPHVDGCHDVELDHRLQFGQYCGVRRSRFEILYTGRKFIYGRHNQFNTEDEWGNGKPCGKVAVGHLLRLRDTDLYLAVVNVHGFWSRHGKRDQRERFEQNRGINTLVERLCEHAPTDQTPVVVIGDLNYTSRMMALYDLAHQPCFGEYGGVILNHRYGIKDTRTALYTKAVREADYAIVSPSLLPYIKHFEVDLVNVPSDHGLLRLTLEY